MFAHTSYAVAAAALFYVAAVGIGTQASAQTIKQVKLTEQQVTGLIAAQDDFAPLAGKLAEANDDPNPELMAKLNAAAKKHGFKDFDEYRDVDNNIFLVLEGLDRSSGEYVPPEERLKLEISEIESDQNLPAEEKEAILDEVRQELKMAEPVQHPENIELVKKHIDELSTLLPAPEDPEPEDDDDLEEDQAQ